MIKDEAKFKEWFGKKNEKNKRLYEFYKFIKTLWI